MDEVAFEIEFDKRALFGKPRSADGNSKILAWS